MIRWPYFLFLKAWKIRDLTIRSWFHPTRQGNVTSSVAQYRDRELISIPITSPPIRMYNRDDTETVQ